jgi:hypothetical protein
MAKISLTQTIEELGLNGLLSGNGDNLSAGEK